MPTMAKFLCRCGAVIHTSGGIPNPHQWMLVSDMDFDQLAPAGSDALYRAATIAFRCGSCNRLWIYWDGFDSEPISYAPEAG